MQSSANLFRKFAQDNIGRNFRRPEPKDEAAKKATETAEERENRLKEKRNVNNKTKQAKVTYYNFKEHKLNIFYLYVTESAKTLFHL